MYSDADIILLDDPLSAVDPEVANKNELNVLLAGNEVEEGDLLIFPGYLPHKVSKNESNEDRIVISFNVDVK